MSVELTEFEDFIASVPGRDGPFRPFAYRDKDGGGIEVFLSNEVFRGEYVTPRLTLYVGERTGRLVGFRVEDAELLR